MNRYYLVVLACFALLSGCSKDTANDYPDLETTESADIKAIIKEYSIKKEGLTIESFTSNLDSTALYVNGRIKECLWVGGYDIATKKQILDFTENSKLDMSISYNIGYGEYLKFDIEKYTIVPHPYSFNGFTCFILLGAERGGSGENQSRDLYFLQDNLLKNKYRNVYYPSTQKFFIKIIPWFESVMIKLNYDEYQCFNMQGNELFSIKRYNANEVENCEPINIEEGIYSTYWDEPNSLVVKRLNIKTGITIWDKTINPFTEKVKVGNYKITKSNDIWVYSMPYTNFDGIKGNIQISLNIENGDFEIK